VLGYQKLWMIDIYIYIIYIYLLTYSIYIYFWAAGWIDRDLRLSWQSQTVFNHSTLSRWVLTFYFFKAPHSDNQGSFQILGAQPSIPKIWCSFVGWKSKKNESLWIPSPAKKLEPKNQAETWIHRVWIVTSVYRPPTARIPFKWGWGSAPGQCILVALV
jgi:hypothetical protein